MAIRVLGNCRIATMETGYNLIENGVIEISDDVVSWVGSEENYQGDKTNMENLGGRLVTPGLIDCHTHLVFGGDRAREFEMRLKGASYEEISKAGGGIVSTMKATRLSSLDELVESALPRLDALIAEGVTTLEIKSGYGLTIDDEMRMLRAARKLSMLRPVTIVTSWLAAHALPPEFKGREDDYINEIAVPGLKVANSEGLVDAVDGFCEGIAFNVEQIKRVFDTAIALKLPIKLHAEQLSNLGGAVMASELGALSVDHIEYLASEDTKVLAKNDTIAVLLPGAFYTLRETQFPPIQSLRDNSVKIAIASDGNPGSSPLFSILLTMNMACTLFRLTPEEALLGVTSVAGQALGLEKVGIIKEGYYADLNVWNCEHPAELSYRIGFNSLFKRIYRGEDA
ncbi:MAG: imidazolonepropionase [Rhodobacteraceae bacterium]|nr:imidazolonepropionase [Paracoccaceae bacterium]RZO37790.1 MAG: imidazolonepropionase [Paracoccaceae bacterium]